jgi:hypothetical protein
MRLSSIAIVVIALSACGKAETPAPPVSTPVTSEWTVSATALGSTRFGQSIADFARGLGTTPDPTVSLTECEYWTPAHTPAGLGLMVDSGRVVRVDADSSGIKTFKGVGVGSTIAEVEKAYPGMQSMPEKYHYDQGWRWLIAWESDSSAALVFTVDSFTVRNIHAGLKPQALWVEHCS